MNERPRLSVVVVVYNMRREAQRTLHSLSTAYQREVGRDDYEVVVVENGSTLALDPAHVEALPGRFRYLCLDDASSSPAAAVNSGLRHARGESVCVMIDGARIATPGLVARGLDALALGPRTVVASLGWHLGSEYQRCAVAKGYDTTTEDRLLESIAWPADGYRLFEIGTPDEVSVNGWVRPIAESNALFMQRAMWDELGGMDERFDLPGGGLVNPDALARACALDGSQLVVLLGEGTFHQVHGGVATNAPILDWQQRVGVWKEQYFELRGSPLPWTPAEPLLFGSLPTPFLERMVELELEPPPDPEDARVATLTALGLGR